MGPSVTQPLTYKNRKEYLLFLKDRKDSLKREGDYLKIRYGVTVLSTNIILGTQLLKLPSGMSVDRALGTLKSDPRIKDVGRNYIGYPDFPTQTAPPDEAIWLAGDLWGMVKIGMKDAWQLTQNQGHEEIIVAVIDSGFALSTSDLVHNKWVNLGETAGDGVDNDMGGLGPIDDIHGADWCNMQTNGQPSGTPNVASGHGTEVAGVIGAQGNNGADGAGVTWVVKLMSLKVLCESNPKITQHRSAQAITYAVFMGAHVINNSYGIYTNSPNLEWLKAINLANCQGPAPVPPDCHPALIVASAGNENKNIDDSTETTFVALRFPAMFSTAPHVISVGAVMHTDNRWEFSTWEGSNWGSSGVSIAAPGHIICTTHKDGGTICPSGTSLAAPFVSGCAALLQAKRRELSLALLPGSQLKQIILESADRVPQLGDCGATGDKDCVVGKRRLNCLQAFFRLPVCSGNCVADTSVPNPPLNLTVTQ